MDRSTHAEDRGDPAAVAPLLAELKRAYRDAGLDCADGLKRPARKPALDKLAHGLSLPLPPELVAVLAVHGGQRYFGSGTTGLFGSHRLHTPAEVLSKYRMYEDTWHRTKPWDTLLIPFASWDAYDVCVHSRTGEVREFTPNHGGVTRCHRPSIVAVLRELLGAVRAGCEPELQG